MLDDFSLFDEKQSMPGPGNSVMHNWRQLTRCGLYSCILVLSAVLLLAQGIELSHSHEDLQSQLDCQICVKHNGKGKMLLTSIFSFDLQTTQAFTVDRQTHRPFLALPAARSRAPPQLFSS